ncbi:MAG: trypsin-like serine protease [Elusimicrobiota bacterium]
MRSTSFVIPLLSIILSLPAGAWESDGGAGLDPDLLPSACEVIPVNSKNEPVAHCSGHLWNGSNIITAAHCLFERDPNDMDMHQPRGVKIYAECRIAAHSGKALANTAEVLTDYKRVLVHRDYFAKTDTASKYSRFPVDELDVAIVQNQGHAAGANQNIFSWNEAQEDRLLRSGRCYLSGFSRGFYLPEKIEKARFNEYGKSVQIENGEHGDSGGGVFCIGADNKTYVTVLLYTNLLGHLRMSHVVKLFPDLIPWEQAKRTK